MVSTHDARYILGEIRNIQYYETRIAELNLKLAEISEQIQDASAPRSPNGGHDVMVNGRTVRIRIHGGEYDSGSAVTALITRQKPIEAEYRDFRRRCDRAREYKAQVVKRDDTGFAEAFLSGQKTYRQLQDEYYVSNPYDKMLRIIASTVSAV